MNLKSDYHWKILNLRYPFNFRLLSTFPIPFPYRQCRFDKIKYADIAHCNECRLSCSFLLFSLFDIEEDFLSCREENNHLRRHNPEDISSSSSGETTQTETIDIVQPTDRTCFLNMTTTTRTSASCQRALPVAVANNPTPPEGD